LERKQIALVFSGSYAQWSGGIIYILNIIQALKDIKSNDQPAILIIHSPEAPIEDIKKINYPHLSFLCFKPSFFQLAINSMGRRLFGKNLIKYRLPQNNITSIYPYGLHLAMEQIPNRVFWIPDFQYIHLPHMYEKKDIEKIQARFRKISQLRDVVVFSSLDAQNDYIQAFPNYKNKLQLLRFAQALPPFKTIDISALRAKHKLPVRYFLVPNQFWKHKNHLLVLEALSLLKQQGKNTMVAFTGNENDYRNKDYITDIKNYIINHQLEEQVRFLGFIDRAEQLQLMNNAISIIQPSLFEGWSTVVEDAKAMGQYILLSNIPLHQEQIGANCEFFDPFDANELANLMKQYLLSDPVKKPVDYNQNILEFQNELKKVLGL
jgi:glycosyltransferase involved in cell wall biosynthesis